MNKVVLLLFLVLLSLTLLTSCFSKVGQCNEDSPAVVRAKSLSDDELKTLLNDVRKYYEAKELGQGDLKIPKSVQNLLPEHIRIEGRGRIFLYLNVCGFDSKTIMVIDASDNSINMSWGDYGSPKAGNLQLWPEA